MILTASLYGFESFVWTGRGQTLKEDSAGYVGGSCDLENSVEWQPDRRQVLACGFVDWMGRAKFWVPCWHEEKSELILL